MAYQKSDLRKETTDALCIRADAIAKHRLCGCHGADGVLETTLLALQQKNYLGVGCRLLFVLASRMGVY